MNISCELYDEVAVITIDGELSVDTAEAFKNTVETSFQDGSIFFVVNFEKVSLIDSEGLEALLWLKDKCEQSQGQVKIAALDEVSANILRITRIDRDFDTHGAVIEAVKSFT